MGFRVFPRLGLAGCVLVAAMGVATPGNATSVRPMNVVDLLANSTTIVVGQVDKVTDGFDANGVPYTEVTLKVLDPIRGAQGRQHTFRQFGLSAPRESSDGRIYLGGRPDGWPTWNEGEVAMVFLYPKARVTGLQTTVGLGYGKLSVGNGLALNGYDNTGLFQDVKVSPGLLNKEEARLLKSGKGPVDAGALQSMLHRAVKEKWVEQGRIRSDAR